MRAFPVLPPNKTVASSGGGIPGEVTADDYSVANGATVVLTFTYQRLLGSVTADDYSVGESDPVVLEFA